MRITICSLLLVGITAAVVGCGDDDASGPGGTAGSSNGGSAVGGGSSVGGAGLGAGGSGAAAGGGNGGGGGDQDALVLDTLKASPGAEGWGALAEGGRTGKLIIVDTLEDTDEGSYDESCDCYEGSFRWAMTRPFPATIVFRVSGVLELNSTLSVSNEDMGHKTILGATAPYPGIVGYGDRVVISDVDNVIVRGITWLNGGGNPGNDDSWFFADGTDLYVADNTLGWASDEVLTASGCDRMTAQRNLLVECHPDHNTGSIVGDTVASVEDAGSYSWHHNVYVHISHRFPNLAGTETSFIDGINNVAYNYQSRLSRANCNPMFNNVNNYFKPGPATSTSSIFERGNKWSYGTEGNPACGVPNGSIHSVGNIIEGFFDDPNGDNRQLWTHFLTGNGYVQNEPLPDPFFTDTMHAQAPVPVEVHSAAEAFDELVTNKNVGARYYTDSDGVPQRYMLPLVDEYLEDAIQGTDDAHRDDVSAFVIGTLPASEPAYADADRDSMPDSFEDEHGLDKNDPADGLGTKAEWTIEGRAVINDAGYTNREIFFFWILGDLADR